jgi:hypothetical protein
MNRPALASATAVPGSSVPGSAVHEAARPAATIGDIRDTPAIRDMRAIRESRDLRQTPSGAG